MLSPIQNAIIVKIQSHLYSNVYKSECEALSIIVREVTKNISNKQYGELKLSLTLSAEEIIKKYY